MSTGQRVHSPMLDIDGDDILEWGDPDVRIGSWGFQNHFSTGEKSHKASFGFSGLVEASAWIPATNLEQFGVSMTSENGNMTGMSLRIGGSTILSKTLDNVTVYRLELNASEQSLLKTTLGSQGALLNNMGQGYALVEMEVYGNGIATFFQSCCSICNLNNNFRKSTIAACYGCELSVSYTRSLSIH